MLTVLFIFILGLAIGSFLNVVIDRLPNGESIIIKRSHCDMCEHTLSWYDLIPLFSFFILGGKCRYCKSQLSWQYPFIELINGLLYLVIYFVFFRNLSLSDILPVLYLFTISSGLFVIFMIDLKYKIIPDSILLFLVCLIFLYHFFTSGLYGYGFLNFLFSGIGLMIFFLVLLLITKGHGMGMGDVKFAFLIGFLLGFQRAIIAFYLSFLTGALISIILVIGRRKKMKETIPFGPFLSLATFLSLLFASNFISFYNQIFGF